MNGYDRDDLVAALRAAGLRAGDCAFVSTSLGLLGVAAGATSMDGLCALALSALQEVVGEAGSILAPAYSYTIGRSRASEPALFDPGITPGEVGPFPEYLRRQPGALRSCDPMTSVVGLGAACAPLFADLPPTSYGEDCLFARMARWPAMKCVSIGLGSNWTAFIHHADWLARVPFRYDKLFHGLIRDDQGARDVWWMYAVPVRLDCAFANAHRLGRMAEEAGIWHHAPVGRARVYGADYADYFRFARDALAADPWLLAQGPVCDVLAEEEARAGYPAITVDSVTALWSLPRASVSPQMDAAMALLAREYGIALTHYRTGHNAFDWVVPEKWHCAAISLRCVDSGREIADVAAALSSLAVDEEVEIDRLHRHLVVADEMPWHEDFNNRDWILTLSAANRAGLTGQRYHVRIDARASMGTMIVGESVVPGGSDGVVVVAATLAGQWGGAEMLSGVETLLAMLRQTREGGWDGPELRFLLLPGPVGFAAWLADHAHLPIRAAMHLRNLSGAGGYFLHNLPPAHPLAVAAAQAGAAVEAASPWFDPLAPGHNPVAKARLADLPFVNPVFGRAENDVRAPSPFAGWGSRADIPVDAEVSLQAAAFLLPLLRHA